LISPGTEGPEWVESVSSPMQEAAVRLLDAATSAIRHIADVEPRPPQRPQRPRTCRPQQGLIVLGHVEVAEKSNEIPAAQALIESLRLPH